MGDSFDLVTLGELLYALRAPYSSLLAKTRVLNCHATGAEANVAIGASRLGLDAAFISKVCRSFIGDFTVDALPQMINRFGLGDAFAAGFLCEYSKHGLSEALRYATAAAALKATYTDESYIQFGVRGVEALIDLAIVRPRTPPGLNRIAGRVKHQPLVLSGCIAEERGNVAVRVPPGGGHDPAAFGGYLRRTEHQTEVQILQPRGTYAKPLADQPECRLVGGSRWGL